MIATLRALVVAVWPLVGTVAWVAAIAFSARSAAFLLADHPRLAYVLIMTVSAVGGVGGLIGFWYSTESIEFFVRGYRIWCRHGRFVYEERSADGSIRGMPFGWRPLTDEYRAPCEVYVPSLANWDEEVPSWARGRRSEIKQRIWKCLSSIGVSVRFVDRPLPAPDDHQGK